MISILKGQYATDVFTTQAEARVRSMELGLDGVTHAYDYDGQAVYMPAASHEAYGLYGGLHTRDARSLSSGPLRGSQGYRSRDNR